MTIYEKYYDEKFGWGEIIEKTDNFMVIRFDANPWCLQYIYFKET